LKGATFGFKMSIPLRHQFAGRAGHGQSSHWHWHDRRGRCESLPSQARASSLKTARPSAHGLGCLSPLALALAATGKIAVAGRLGLGRLGEHIIMRSRAATGTGIGGAWAAQGHIKIKLDSDRTRKPGPLAGLLPLAVAPGAY
jgi:hypothetical protein